MSPIDDLLQLRPSASTIWVLMRSIITRHPVLLPVTDSTSMHCTWLLYLKICDLNHSGVKGNFICKMQESNCTVTQVIMCVHYVYSLVLDTVAYNVRVMNILLEACLQDSISGECKYLQVSHKLIHNTCTWVMFMSNVYWRLCETREQIGFHVNV